MTRLLAINSVVIGGVLVVVSGWHGQAGAATAAPDAPAAAPLETAAVTAEPPPHGAGNCPQQGLDQMLAALPQCQTNARFLFNLGYRLNREGRYAEALDHLERALMLDPDLKGARIDFALALAGSGDAPAALALIDELLRDPELPEPLVPVLRRQQRQLDRLARDTAALASSGAPLPTAGTAGADGGPGGGLRVRKTAAVRLGHDSNLLGAPNLSSLTLTAPGGGALTLPLDGSLLARAGLYLRADASLELSATGHGGVNHEAVLNLQARRSPSEDNANARQYELFYEGSRPAARDGAPGHYAQASLGGLEINTGVRYRVLRLAGGGEWGGLWPTRRPGVESCSTRLGAELQDRELASTPVLSGRYLAGTVQWRCAPPDGRYWQVAAQYGQDTPKDSSRPGGRQTQYSLRLTGVWPLRPWLPWAGGSALLDLEYTHTRDRNGYSPLLANGAARRAGRTSARAEWQHALGRSAQGVLGVQWLHQAANIELFAQRSWGPYAGVRLAW